MEMDKEMDADDEAGMIRCVDRKIVTMSFGSFAVCGHHT
jgi:hypothetical protein